MQRSLKSAIQATILSFSEQERMYSNKGRYPMTRNSDPLRVADIKREGTDATIVARSLMVPYALKAAEEPRNRAFRSRSSIKDYSTLISKPL
jgi:pyruvate dehydrogenase E1 component beta subunit